MRIGKCGAHTRQEKANPLRMKGGAEERESKPENIPDWDNG